MLLALKQPGLSNPRSWPSATEALTSGPRLRRSTQRTKEQRCWVHEMANVLNNMPMCLQAKAKSALHQIWLAENQEMAANGLDHLLGKYGPKYEAAGGFVSKDGDALVAFYDFPAEHWSQPANDQSHPQLVADDPTAASPREGEPIEKGRPHHNVQARSGSQPPLGPAQRSSRDRSWSLRKDICRRGPAERRPIHALGTHLLPITLSIAGLPFGKRNPWQLWRLFSRLNCLDQ